MENKTVLKGGLSIISQCKKETNDIWHAHFEQLQLLVTFS